MKIRNKINYTNKMFKITFKLLILFLLHELKNSIGGLIIIYSATS